MSKEFKITITSWAKHNENKKKNHRFFLLSNRFFYDDKIAQLSAIETRLYLYLLTVASDLHQSSYTLHTNLIPTYFRVRTDSIQTMLTKFESLQLLSYEKSVSNRIEKNRKEKKTILKDNENLEDLKKEKKHDDISLALQPAADKSAAESKTAYFISLYCSLFKEKYGSNPHITKKESGIAKRCCVDLSEEKISLFLNAFFKMPDSFLLKTKHPISQFEYKKNEIVVFANSGNFVTQKQAFDLDKSASTFSTLNLIREGKL